MYNNNSYTMAAAETNSMTTELEKRSVKQEKITC